MRNKILIIVTTVVTTFITLNNQNIMAQKIQNEQHAPDFTITDVNGKMVDLSEYKGKKVILCFYRNVGCPICNLRFHQLEEMAPRLKVNNTIVISVYESSAENMKKYLDGKSTYSVMVPNPDLSLYNKYGIELSINKMMKGMFNGAMSKMTEGKKLFKQKIKQDGNSTRIGAEFLIDTNGNIVKAYYGKYVGDFLSDEQIDSFIK
jgi:thioredoxin-dependent peroxiredoxin